MIRTRQTAACRPEYARNKRSNIAFYFHYLFVQYNRWLICSSDDLRTNSRQQQHTKPQLSCCFFPDPALKREGSFPLCYYYDDFQFHVSILYVRNFFREKENVSFTELKFRSVKRSTSDGLINQNWWPPWTFFRRLFSTWGLSKWIAGRNRPGDPSHYVEKHIRRRSIRRGSHGRPNL